jgi:hypothetical protein
VRLPTGHEEDVMNEETLNLELRKFLKQVGVTSQRAIESAVREALAAGRLEGTKAIAARMTLELPALGARHVVDGMIALG